MTKYSTLSPVRSGASIRARVVRIALLTLVPLAFLAAAPAAHSTQLNLSQTPLFLTVHVPPNIFFLQDDSGSMDWQMVTTESSGLHTGVMFLSAGGHTTTYSYLFPDADHLYGPPFSTTYGRILPDEDEIMAATNMPADAHGVWRGRYHGYNKIYYNPDVNYKPWPGVDSAGNPFPDAKAGMPLTAVRLDPYLSSTASNTVDLTSDVTYTSLDVPRTDGTTTNLSITLFPATYYTWTDTNSDGVIDAADAHTRYEIRTTGCSAGAICPATFTRPATRVDCSGVSGTQRVCTATEELENFANWYSYYRRRYLTAKGAIAGVIAPKGDEVRMGHATLFSDSSSSGRNIPVAQMNSSLSSGAKKALLDRVYRQSSGLDTPLRGKFDALGKYFLCASSGAIFPSGYTCPILPEASGGSCQQNFAILMTDGYYNDSFSSSSIGNSDADGSSPSSAGDTAFDGGAYADTRSNTLADIAMRYYERDLDTSLPNKVPVIAGVDEASHQHLNTYAVAFGVTGTLTAGPTDPAAAFAWPNPGAGDLEKIDDLRHATYNGRGEFFSASDPDALSAALQSAVDRITELTGSASAVAVNSRSLSTNTRLYQGRFTSGQWSGDLRSISVDASTGAIGAQLWSAKTQLASQDWDTGRSILTFRRTAAVGACAAGSGAEGGIAFRWADISTTQQCLLNDDPATSAFDNDANGDLRVDYLRGDTSQEGQGANFRPRLGGYKLGDIVNSSPIYVGAPTYLPELEAEPFSTFRNTFFNRPEMIYVGANDGMLHGFDANTGEEKLAYVPSMLYPNLNKLTHTGYAHQYYVDGSPTVGDAFGAFGTGRCGGASASCWRSVLTGGLAGGGKGIYALNVTDPTTFNEANAANLALWEFTDSTTSVPGNDMGYVYGEVAIARMQNGKWAAIFGNGYNSAGEKAVLYIVNIDDGTLIKKIALTTTAGAGNGLSAPAVVDVDGDYIADYIYAGDLNGNMWKIDVTNSNPTNWSNSVKLLFAATDGSVAQAITQRPEVGAHPDGKGGYMVYFGTGRYIADGDRTPHASPINSFYGIWDKNTSSAPTVTRADLLAQSITTQTTVSTDTDPTVDSDGDGDPTNDADVTTDVRAVSSNAIDWKVSSSTGTHLGWVLNLRTDQTDSLGEMSVSNPVLVGGTLPRLIFTTLVPEGSACSFGGRSWLMEVSPTNGGNLNQDIFDVDGDGLADNNDRLGSGETVSGISPDIGIMPEPVILRDPSNGRDFKIITGSKGDVKSQKNFVPKAASGRQSWRQIK